MRSVYSDGSRSLLHDFASTLVGERTRNVENYEVYETERLNADFKAYVASLEDKQIPAAIQRA